MNDINLAQDIYTHEDVLRMLRKNRTVRFEYIIRNQYNQTMGSLTNASGSISFDSSQAIMRTCKITAKKSELLTLASVDNRIVPYFCLLSPNGHWLHYPLGVFIINPSSILQNKATYITVDGYDLAEIATSMRLTDVLTLGANTVITSAISQRISSIYSLYDIETDTAVFPNTVEYEIGNTEIETINALLETINYYPLFFDENGKAHAEPYIFPEQRTVQMVYEANKDSIIYDGVSQATDLFNIPNKFVRYTNDADSISLRSEYTVTDESIPSSITRRGRVITDVQQVQDIATQDVLDSYTIRAAVTASQVCETLQFNSMLMPGHGYKNCLQVVCPDADIDSKYIETAWEMDLKAGGQMTHKCYKAVIT